jgi:hypothetical protein
MTWMRRLAARRGASGFTYGLVVGLVAVVSILAVSRLGSGVSAMLGGTETGMNGALEQVGALPDTTRPRVTSIDGPAPGTYGAGQELAFTLHFSEPVSGSGTLCIPISVDQPGDGDEDEADRTACGALGPVALAAVNALSALTVVAILRVRHGAADSDGIALGDEFYFPSGGLADAAGNPLYEQLPATEFPDVLLNGVSPTVTGATGPESGVYGLNQDLSFVLTFSAPVEFTGDAALPLTIGGQPRQATRVGPSGFSTTHNFTYTLASGDNGATAASGPLVLVSGEAADSAGNDADLAFGPVSLPGVTADTSAPTITSVTAPGPGNYATGNVLTFTLNFSESVTASGNVRIPVVIGSNTRYAVLGTSGGAAQHGFSYTIIGADADNDGIQILSPAELNGGSLQDGAGNAAALAFSPPGLATVKVNATGLFVAVGDAGVIRTTTTAANTAAWSSVSAPSNHYYAGVIHDGSLYIAVGRDSTASNASVVRTSANGTSWTTRTSPSTTQNVRGIATSGTAWVIAGSSGRVARATSATGSYSQIDTGTGISYTGIAYGGGKFVAGGGNSSPMGAYSTDDGATWTSLNGLGVAFACGVVYAQGKFWVGGCNSSGSNNDYSTSVSGTSFTGADCNFSNNATGIGAANNWVHVYGQDSTVCYANPTGTRQPVGSGGSQLIEGEAYGNNIWVFVGRGGVFSTSSNGVSISTQSSTGVATDLKGVAFGVP